MNGAEDGTGDGSGSEMAGTKTKKGAVERRAEKEEDDAVPQLLLLSWLPDLHSLGNSCGHGAAGSGRSGRSGRRGRRGQQRQLPPQGWCFQDQAAQESEEDGGNGRRSRPGLGHRGAAKRKFAPALPHATVPGWWSLGAARATAKNGNIRARGDIGENELVVLVPVPVPAHLVPWPVPAPWSVPAPVPGAGSGLCGGRGWASYAGRVFCFLHQSFLKGGPLPFPVFAAWVSASVLAPASALQGTGSSLAPAIARNLAAPWQAPSGNRRYGRWKGPAHRCSQRNQGSRFRDLRCCCRFQSFQSCSCCAFSLSERRDGHGRFRCCWRRSRRCSYFRASHPRQSWKRFLCFRSRSSSRFRWNRSRCCCLPCWNCHSSPCSNPS